MAKTQKYYHNTVENTYFTTIGYTIKNLPKDTVEISREQYEEETGLNGRLETPGE